MIRSRLWTAICFLTLMAAGIGLTLLGSTYESLTLRYAMPLSDAGIFTGVQALGATISVIIAGRLLDRLDVRVVLCGGTGLFGAGVLLLGVSTVLWLGLLGTLLLGVGFGMLLAGPNYVIASVYRERASSALNALNFFYGIGAIIGPQLVAYAIRQGNFVIAYIVGGCLMLALTLPCLVINLRPPPRTTLNRPVTVIDWNVLLPLIVLLFCYIGCEVGFGSWIFTQVSKVAKASTDEAALATSVFWGGLTVGRGVAVIILRWLRDEQILPLSILVIGFGTLLLLLMGNSAPLSIVCAFVVGVGCGPIFPTSLAITRKLFAAEYGMVSGILIGCGNIGAILLPWLQGQVGAGQSGGMIVVLVSAAVMFGVLMIVRQRIALVPALAKP
jgi:fucose permease